MLGLGLGLSLGVSRRALAASVPSTPNLIVLSASEVAEDAANGTVIGFLFTFGGTAPYNYALTTNPGSRYAIVGNELRVASSLDGLTTDDIAIEVTDANSATLEQEFTIDVVEAIDNGSGIGEDDGDIVVPDPEDPESDGGGFEEPPVQQNTSEGLKIAGKNGGSATFFKDWGVPVAGAVVTMRYTADWSGMSRQGRMAAVGFAFKDGNDFHLVGLRGNGAASTVMRKSKIYGDFRKANKFTVTDDGAAAHGTKDGPNWLQIEFDGDGENYTLRTSSNGSAWTDAYSDAVPVPLDTVTDALQFGPGGYFTNQDKGVFSITIETFETEGFVPAQFAPGDWSVADAKTFGEVTVTIAALPEDSGSPITDIEYQIDGGAWVSLGAAVPDDYTISGLSNGAEVDIAIRALNEHGPGTASATKAVTPTAPPTYTFLSPGLTSGAGATHNDVPFGAAPPSGQTRHILVSFAWTDSITNKTLSGVTIGGVSATRLHRAQGDTQTRNVEFWIAAVPTGTTGTIAWTSGGNRCSIAVYRVMNLADGSAAAATAIAAGTGSADLSVQAGDLVFAAQARGNTADVNFTSGVSEDYGASAGTVHHGDHGSVVAASTTTLNIQTDQTATRNLAAVALR